MDNLRGALLMAASMLGFAFEDMLIKQLAATLPIGQVIALLGAGGTLIFAAVALARGQRLWSPALLTGPVMLRSLGELIGTAAFVSALVLTTLSSASAILQATPLAVTLGAAAVLGERVGWQRWTAIGVGALGVILIVRPGTDGLAPGSLLAVLAVAGLALRDLAVRHVPAEISSGQIAVWGFATVVATGMLMMLALGAPPAIPSWADVARLAGALVAGGLGYYSLVVATRTGDVAAVVPFRYTRLVFAMIIGHLVFGERPDAPTLAGAALIVGAGLYTMWRESRPGLRTLPGRQAEETC